MSRITVHDIIDWVTRQKGRSLNKDEGITFGPAVRDVSGLTVCWMPDPPAIAAAAEAGHELLIHHEALTFPYPGMFPDDQRRYLTWPTNVARLTALGQAGMTACRIHGSADELFICRASADQLGLGEPIASGDTSSAVVYGIPPTPYGQLIDRVKKAMGMDHLRATCCGGMDRVVSRVGMPWGGMALFTNVGYMQRLIELGVDVMIAGESDSYGMRFVAELGIDLIETSHEASEDEGLLRFTDALASAFPAIDVGMVRQECVWRVR